MQNKMLRNRIDSIILNQKPYVNRKRPFVNRVGGSMIYAAKKTTGKRSLYTVQQRILAYLKSWTEAAKQGKRDYGWIHEGELWFHNTQDQWAALLKVSTATVWRALQELVKKGKIRKAYLSENKNNRTLFYTLCKNEETVNNSVDNSVNNFSSEELNDEMRNDMIHIKAKAKTEIKSTKSGGGSSLRERPPASKTKLQSNREKSAIVQQFGGSVADMLEAANRILKLKEHMAKDLGRMLGAVRKYKLHTMEKWKSFLETVKGSWYLMREGFRLTLRWLVKFDIINRIMNGEFGCQKKTCELENRLEYQAATEKETAELIANTADEKLKSLMNGIVAMTDACTFRSWFAKGRFEFTDTGVTLYTPSDFCKEQIETRFRRVLAEYNISVEIERGVKGLISFEGDENDNKKSPTIAEYAARRYHNLYEGCRDSRPAKNLDGCHVAYDWENQRVSQEAEEHAGERRQRGAGEADDTGGYGSSVDKHCI